MFKFLPLFLISVTSFAAVQNSRIVKSTDGKIAYCSSARNVGAYAYMPSNFSVSSDGEYVNVDLNMSAIKCAQVSGGYNWVSRAFNAPQHKTSLEGVPVVIKFRNQAFRLISSDYKIIGAVNVASESSKHLGYSLEVSQILNQAALEQLANGSVVRARLELFMWGLSSYTMNGRTTNVGPFSGGSYVITFDVKKSDNGVVVSNAKFF